MPELPEVETVCRWLRSTVLNRPIVQSQVLWERTLHKCSADALARGVINATIQRVTRRGKYIVAHLTTGRFLIVHLRMSGELRLAPGDEPLLKHDRVAFRFADSEELRFNDPRKFGRMYFTENLDTVLGKLGIEPLEEGFTPEALTQRITTRKGILKSLLLDQSIIAGLGNIYAVESLWDAKLHPLRRGDTLSVEEIGRLHNAIQGVLRRAVESGGTDLGDGVWKKGGFTTVAYGREGDPCSRCTTKMKRIVVAQRGTEFCPRCQQARRSKKLR